MKHNITPLHSETVATKEFTKPSTVKGLKEFLGMVNFYHCFIPSAASIIQPLYQAVAGNTNSYIQWTKERIAAFICTKEVLVNATILTYPQTNASLAITVYASGVAVGAILKKLIMQ